MGKYEEKSEAISVRVPTMVALAIDDLIEKRIYGSRADFMKAASRYYLRELGYLKPREIKGPEDFKNLNVGKGFEECKECEIMKYIK